MKDSSVLTLAGIGFVIMLAAYGFPSLGNLKITEPPKAVISGTTHADPGDLITLRGDDSTGGGTLHYTWSVTPELANKPQFKVVENGKAIQLFSRPGVWRVQLIVSNETGKVSTALWDVTISGTPAPLIKPNGPSPLPVDPPPPVDPKPDDPHVPPAPTPTPVPVVLSDDAKTIYNAVIAVSSPNRQAECAQLSADCKALMDKIDKNPAMGLNAITDEIVASLAKLPASWKTVQASAFATFKNAYQAGDLRTATAWKAKLNQFYIGLKEAEKVAVK